ncbi:MAG: hypothetical protein HYT50_01725 [Candidatus Wildermuthbacteria bacterium]|nr:hypothetical protein [Candidatus Wildermuthbacteria bacterium]
MYRRTDEISDQEIREEFARATEVVFAAKPYNYPTRRFISFGLFDEERRLLPLARVLMILGITPQMLRPIFSSPYWKTVKRRGSGERELQKMYLPRKIATFDQLGSFPLSKEKFLQFAVILGRPIRVLREHPTQDRYSYLFTVDPPGEVVAA